MRRALLLVTIAALVVGFAGPLRAQETATAEINVMVTVGDVGISCTPETWNLQIVAFGSTSGPADFSCTNTGTLAANVSLQSSDSADWRVGSPAGDGVFEVVASSGSLNGPLTTMPQPLSASLAPSDSVPFTLTYSAATAGTGGAQNFTITASAGVAVP